MADYAAALALAAEIRDTLADLDPAPVVTLDYAEATATVNTTRAALVLVQPPALTYPTPYAADADYTLIVCSGLDPIADQWQAMTDVIGLLVPAFDVTEARPAGFQPAQGPLLNCYQVTLTRSYDL